MVLDVIMYGHPVLREKGARIASVTPEIRQLIADMFETMYAAHGVGLAAQQVGRSLQLTVLDVRGVTDRPSSLEVEGRPVDPAEYMPMTLINPEVRPLAPAVDGPEGCLSFPEIYADISRPEFVQVRALNADGQPMDFRCGGLLARAVQHEVDHLQGILFIDRMKREVKEKLRAELDDLHSETKAALRRQK
jgi:peptide deformylase